MSEDKEVDVGMIYQILLGKLHEIFVVLAKITGIATLKTMLQTTATSPLQTEGDGPARVQTREAPLAETIAEEGAKNAETATGIAQSVAMPKIEHAVGQFNRNGVVVNSHATLLLEIVLGPDVVVAGKEMNLYPIVGKFGYLSQNTRISLRDNMLVLIPEVKYVTQEIDGRRLVLDLIKEAYHTPLLLTRMRNGSTAQMGIGKEIYVLQK